MCNGIRLGEIVKLVASGLVLLMFSGIAHAQGRISLPKTGQTTCYNENGTLINCTGTGQDGDIQAGVEWPSSRFYLNSAYVFTDKLTGLMWVRNEFFLPSGSWFF